MPGHTHTIVMTGASRGIGRIAAEHLLAADPELHLVVLARGSGGQKLAAELAAAPSGPRPTVSHIEADLASLVSVREAAGTIVDRLDKGELPPLSGFVGNAGIQYTNDLTTSADGLEATFAVNVLANYVFVRLLEPAFANPSRIVITVSDTHFGDFRHNMGMVPAPSWLAPDALARTGAFPEPDKITAGRTAYSTSKLAAIYLVHELARRLPAGVDVVSYNPGFVPGTDLVRDAGGLQRFMMRRVLPSMTVTPFATSRSAAGRYLANVVLGKTAAPTGSYVDRRQADRSSEESYDRSREAELWATLEQLESLR